MEHVHNRRQKYMTNSLLDIGARAFGIVTPDSRYRRVIIYTPPIYIPRTRMSLYLLRVHVIYSNILRTLENYLIYISILRVHVVYTRKYVSLVYI